jgi:hypothetical protein
VSDGCVGCTAPNACRVPPCTWMLQIMTMQLRELGFRMIAIKTLLPGCDAARLVELQPR